MAETILLVEDEEKLARMVEMELRYEGYEVTKAFDGRSGLEQALSGKYDLVLLDIMLPQLSGMEVLRRLRRESDLPVIMLTARDSVIDKVSGLDSGADDYITKPCHRGAAGPDPGCSAQTGCPHRQHPHRRRAGYGCGAPPGQRPGTECGADQERI